jgi:hypothetical protein
MPKLNKISHLLFLQNVNSSSMNEFFFSNHEMTILVITGQKYVKKKYEIIIFHKLG